MAAAFRCFDMDVVRPASMSAMAQCYNDQGLGLSLNSRWRAAFFQQFFESVDVTAIYYDGQLVSLFGFYPMADHHELWFMPGPAAARRPVAAMRATAGQIKILCRSYKDVLCSVVSDQPRSVRLAKLLGLKPTGVTGVNAGTNYEVYSWVASQKEI